MKARFRKVAVFVGAAALAAGTGIGVAASSDDSASSGAPGSSRSAPGVTGGRQAPGGLDVSALADELGVTEAQLEEAMRKTRPTDPSVGAGPDAMFQALADELGLSADKVRRAFENAFGSAGPPQGGGQQATPPATPGATSQS
jgi:hypothetical protein